MEERLTELEIRFARHQALLQDLSDVLIAQQQQIDVLKSELGYLRSKVTAEPGYAGGDDHEPPPHY